MNDTIRSLSDREIAVVAGGLVYTDGTSNTIMFLHHVERDNALAKVEASALGQTK
jgi:hypothetical protein